ncbi:hypothetical protein B0F90DRAFT_1210730 [Multifurca ochricompacta]|uniref:Uncharacterized protein n=1 Tax=Multifurca ochricompacta TaxID=376703 RepID=A0AAD4LYG7_9AGAM|nr:hypothetical protein B0F90DRAFT_1210730 [Multifurca ochricompacta]
MNVELALSRTPAGQTPSERIWIYSERGKGLHAHRAPWTSSWPIETICSLSGEVSSSGGNTADKGVGSNCRCCCNCCIQSDRQSNPTDTVTMWSHGRSHHRYRSTSTTCHPDEISFYSPSPCLCSSSPRETTRGAKCEISHQSHMVGMTTSSAHQTCVDGMEEEDREAVLNWRVSPIRYGSYSITVVSGGSLDNHRVICSPASDFIYTTASQTYFFGHRATRMQWLDVCILA